MTNKIDFLNEYSLSSSSVEIVTDESQIVEAPIPNFWKEALLSDSLEERKEKILSVWKEYSSSDLRNTISYLGDYLKKYRLDLFRRRIFAFVYDFDLPNRRRNLL